MIDAPYDVFISHGWHDRWIAAQMARSIKDVGASPFIDIFDIKKGDRIEERVREGLTQCRELIVLLTPWSVSRTWVWTEAGSAWFSDKRVIVVLYGVTLKEIDERHGGAAWLSARNVCAIDTSMTMLGSLVSEFGTATFDEDGFPQLLQPRSGFCPGAARQLIGVWRDR